MKRRSVFALAAPAALLVPLACVAETPDRIEYFEPSPDSTVESIELGRGIAVGDAFAPGFYPRSPVLRVMLTDAPADVDAVFVSIDLVLAFACDDDDCTSGSWTEVTDEAVTLDLLTLQGGSTVEIAEAELPAGVYDKVALFISEASIVVRGEEIAMPIWNDMPSIVQAFDLEAGMRTEVTIDFDAAQSLLPSTDEGWSLRPSVQHVSTTVAPL